MSRTRPPALRPTGRDEVRRAVLDAAVALFSERGPAAVSLREIAAAAQVNLGLLHRHFGSKAELVAAALSCTVERDGSRVAAAFAAGDLPTQVARLATAPAQPYTRMLAWSLLDGADPASLQEQHPGSARLVERLLAEGRDEATAHVTAAAVVALTLGWALFGPWLHVAAGLGDLDRDEIRHHLAAAVSRLVAEDDSTG